MLRRVTYRSATNAFVFTVLWFGLGLLVILSPLPDRLGIGGELFVTWLLFFFAIMGVAGVTLILASVNGAFPSRPPAPRSTPITPATMEERLSTLNTERVPREPLTPRGAKSHGR